MSGGRYPRWQLGIELREDWLALTREEIIDPDREIVDPHHHLWTHGTPQAQAVYELPEFARDTGSGHKVVQTVYIECRARWDLDAPAHLQSVAETAYVAGLAAHRAAPIAGIIAHVDLTLPLDLLDQALDAHEQVGQGRLVGIRHSGACDPEPDRLMIPGRGAPGLYANPDFRRGVARLAARGLTYDTWHYHHQNRDFLDLVRAVPETTMILDHFGTPLGVGRFAGKRSEIQSIWRDDLAELAQCPNLRAKLGGLNMPDNGWGWENNETPPSSDDLLATQADWYRHTIDCFGPHRCMFESNFPVDRTSVSYAVLWNFFKKIAQPFDEAEKSALFAGTARATYGLPSSLF